MSKHNFQTTSPERGPSPGPVKQVTTIFKVPLGGVYGFLVWDTLHEEGEPWCSEPSVPEVEVVPREGVACPALRPREGLEGHL